MGDEKNPEKDFEKEKKKKIENKTEEEIEIIVNHEVYLVKIFLFLDFSRL